MNVSKPLVVLRSFRSLASSVGLSKMIECTKLGVKLQNISKETPGFRGSVHAKSPNSNPLLPDFILKSTVDWMVRVRFQG